MEGPVELKTAPAWERIIADDKGRPMPASDPANARFGGKHALPAIGDTVEVTINRIGLATVTGYFTLEGYLGLLVTIHDAPDWHRKQNNNDAKGYIFGPEFKPVNFPEYTDSDLYNCCANGAAPDWSRFDALELGGCIDLGPQEPGDIDGTCIQGGESRESAEFFTVYGHITGEGVEAITDIYSTYDAALLVAMRLSSLSGLTLKIMC